MRVSFLALLFTISVTCSAQSRLVTADSIDLHSFISAATIDQLEMKFSEMLAAYNQNDINELVLFYGFEPFQNSGPQLAQKLKNWNQAEPDSIAAKLALARHYLHLGWLSRGARWRSETNESQMKGMQDAFSIAEKLYQGIIDEQPKSILAYYGLQSIYMASGRSADALELKKKVFEFKPESYLFNLKRLAALAPIWGGSIEEINVEIANLRKYFRFNSRLHLIKGFDAYVVSKQLTRSDTGESGCFKALSLISKAIEKYADGYLYERRGDINRCLSTYDDAIEDYRIARRINPNDISTIVDLGYSYYKLKRYDDAIAAYTDAINRDNLNSKALRGRGRVYYKKKDYEKAKADFSMALNYGYYNGYTHEKLAYIKYYEKSYIAAENKFKDAIELDKVTSKRLYMLAKSQYKQKECKHLPTVKRFLAYCASNECTNKRLAWAREHNSC